MSGADGACLLWGQDLVVSGQIFDGVDSITDPLHGTLQGWKTGVNGSELWQMLDQSIGWLSSKGYTTKAGIVQQFPVVVGEFGSSLVNEKVCLPTISQPLFPPIARPVFFFN